MGDELEPGKKAARKHPSAGKAPTVSRRRFFTKVGAGGLTVAAVMFGRTRAAHAGNYGCCNLAINPPNKSYADCLHPQSPYTLYVWSCYSNAQACSCCEDKLVTPYGTDYGGSAASCEFV